MIKTPAWKRYNWRVVWLSLAYAALLIGAVLALKYHLVSGVLTYAIAILPALPVIGIIGAIGLYLAEEQDEYVRMLMVRQTLWASGFALSAATIWGFLESFELIGRVDGYYVVIVWFFGLGVGGVINKLTLGDGGC
jgi:xanthosine utilization system XapX-like protein